MRVVHVTPYYAPAWAFGRVPRAVSALARAQAAAGHDVSVLTTDALAPHERLPAGEQPIEQVRVLRARNISSSVRTWLGVSTPLGLRRLARRAFADGVDVVHLHELRCVEHRLVLPLVPSAASVVLSSHDTIGHANRWTLTERLWDAMAAAQVLPRIDAVIARSDEDANAVQALWSARGHPLRADQLSVLPDGHELPEPHTATERMSARERWSLGSGPVVLFLGRISEQSELAVLVRAFAEVTAAVPDARLLAAGSDAGAAIAAGELATALGVEGRVRFTGYLPDEGRRAARAAADLLALPGASPADRSTILDALASGLPVLAGHSLHMGEIEVEGAGRVLAPDPAAWARALRDLLTERRTLDAASANAHRLATAYAWPAVAARVTAIYADVQRTRRR